MGTNEYLQQVLLSQELAEDSSEWKTLIERKQKVEALLREKLLPSFPSIRYGGSRAKGTLIKESYDLDIVCYFANDDANAGDSLKDIYNRVADILQKEYTVVRRRSALRLHDREDIDFHIDVVPGRFTDESKTDCFLHQEGGEKDWLKTNLEAHLKHVKESGLLPAIRLLKLWRVRKALQVRQFPLELLVIKLLSDSKKKSIVEQLSVVLQKITDNQTAISVEDPANPSGNDLTALLSGNVWEELRSVSQVTLTVIKQTGWESVFGNATSSENRKADLKAAAAAVIQPTRPWSI